MFNNYRRCNKCERVFINYAQPDTCIWCGSKKMVVRFIYKAPGSDRDGIDLGRNGATPGKTEAPGDKAPKQ